MCLLFFVTAQQALANEVGDVGSPECLQVQLEAQEAVLQGMGDGYRNHGQMVSTAANVVSPAKESEEITEECSSCIINQFARSITLEEQEPCGEPAAECPCFTHETVDDLLNERCGVVSPGLDDDEIVVYCDIFDEQYAILCRSSDPIINYALIEANGDLTPDCFIRDYIDGDPDIVMLNALTQREFEACREIILDRQPDVCDVGP